MYEFPDDTYIDDTCVRGVKYLHGVICVIIRHGTSFYESIKKDPFNCTNVGLAAEIRLRRNGWKEGLTFASLNNPSHRILSIVQIVSWVNEGPWAFHHLPVILRGLDEILSCDFCAFRFCLCPDVISENQMPLFFLFSRELHPEQRVQR